MTRDDFVAGRGDNVAVDGKNRPDGNVARRHRAARGSQRLHHERFVQGRVNDGRSLAVHRPVLSLQLRTHLAAAPHAGFVKLGPRSKNRLDALNV